MKKYALLVLALIILVKIEAQEKRIAFVVGNAAYLHGGVLKNPVNDANLMAVTLQNLGFTVIKKNNANLKTLQLALNDFSNKIKDYDVALFFYAGHGIQVDGENFLIPVDAKLEEKGMCQYEAFNVGFVSKAFNENSTKLNIIILDACRNNPFRTWMRGYSRGFKPTVNQPPGSIIAYATREDEAASDGIGNYGLYTENLVKQMKKPQNITEVFQNTRIEVLKASGSKQCPQEWNMLTGNFYFNASGKTNQTNQVDPANGELIVGEVITKSGTIDIDSEIGGMLYIDGLNIGKIEASSKGNLLVNQPTGKHQVKIEGNETWIGNVEIFENQTVKLDIKSSFKPGTIDKSGFMTDMRDGKDYKTVMIGDQLWMAENLNYKPEKGSFSYDDNELNNEKYGRLYNLETAVKICPEGWHLPDKYDYDLLIRHLGGNDSIFYQSVIVDGDSGFSALLGGIREMNGASLSRFYKGYYWTSQESENGSPWFLIINKSTQKAFLTYDTRYKYAKIFQETDDWSLSVRCIKN